MGAGTSASTYVQQGATASCNVVSLSGATAFSMKLKFRGSLSIDWGNGTSQYLYSPSTSGEYTFGCTYSAIDNNAITIKGNVNTISSLKSGVGGSTQTQPAFTMIQPETAKFKSLDYLSISDVTGNWIFDSSKLSPTMTYYYNSGVNQSYGSIGQAGTSFLPVVLTQFWALGTLEGHTGSISNLPPNLTIMSSEESSNYTGTINSLPASLTRFNILDTNSVITGNISNLPLGLQNFQVYGKTTSPGQEITGDLGSCLNSRPSMNTFTLRGANTVTCDFSTFSPPIGATAASIELRGNSMVIGNINQITSNIKSLYLISSFNFGGNISDIPITLTSIYLAGTNSQIITGDINSLNAKSLTTFLVNLGLNNTITGDLSTISSTITNLNISSSSMYGDISGLGSKTNLSYIQLTSTTGVVTGNVNSVGSNLKSLYITGTNVNLSGDISSLPTQISTFISKGNFTYSTNKVWPSSMGRVIVQSNVGYGLSTADVDRLLIDLDTYGLTWNASGGRTINLTVNNAPRSLASANAVASLIAKGVNVLTN